MDKTPGAFIRRRHEWKAGSDTTAGGKAARVRVQLDIERIMSANPCTDIGTSEGMRMN